jgi:hypoxanthine phosphoribosyltransferase
MQFKPLFTKAQILSACGQIAFQIRKQINAPRINAVYLLEGAIPFTETLSLFLEPYFEIVYYPIKVSTYENTESVHNPYTTFDFSTIYDRPTLIIDDICDTGKTLKYINENVKVSKRINVVLLDKPSRRQVEFKPDLVGFTIDNVFVVGYGLDLNGKFRSLNYIATIGEE